MLPGLQPVVDCHRSAEADPHERARVLAELEFDLASRLADGPLSFDCEGVRLTFLPGLEHVELQALLDLLVAAPDKLRIALWSLELEHVDVVWTRDAAAAATPARLRLAPDAPTPMTAPRRADDVRRLAAEDALDWLAEAEALPREAPPEAPPELPRGEPSPQRWRAFVGTALAAVPDQEPPSLGLVVAAFDDRLAAADRAAVAAILQAVRTSAEPTAGLVRTALNEPARVARRLAVDPSLGSDAPAPVLAGLLDHASRDVRLGALATLLDHRDARETSPALLATMRSDAFRTRDRAERKRFLEALDRAGAEGTTSFLLSLFDRPDKRDPAAVAAQLQAVAMLRRRWTEPVAGRLKALAKGFRLHRDVRRTIRATVAAEGGAR